MESPRDNSIGAQMAIALQLMKRRNHKAIANSGLNITMEQFAVLETLNFRGDMNMTELSVAAWKQNANITRIVDKLEKQELLVRKPVEGNRRAYMISLTNGGKQLYEKIIPLVIEVNSNATSCLSVEEEAIMLKSLKKLVNHLSKD